MKPHLLIVDDEVNILRALKRLLHNEDVVVTTADSGARALGILEERQFALILSDHQMPGMSGTELLAKVRAKSPETVRIMLTGHADTDAAMAAINEGAVWRFITKPWDDAELRSVIRQGVNQHLLVSENRRMQELIEKQNVQLRDLNHDLERKVVERTGEITELNRRLHERFMGSIRLLADLAEMHDTVIGSHPRRIAGLAGETAKRMDFNERDAFHLVVAATLHDIGKIGIPADVLNKPAHQLTPQEKATIRSHVLTGEQLTRRVFHEPGSQEPGVRGQEEDMGQGGEGTKGGSGSRGVADVPTTLSFQPSAAASVVPSAFGHQPSAAVAAASVPVLIRHQLECFDGTGYPDRLRGNKIPLGSRIIAVVDAFDHRLNGRRTFASTTPERALESLRDKAGKSLDPDVINILASCLQEGTLSKVESFEVDIRPQDLQVDMVLSRELRTLRGVLLLPRHTHIRGEHLRQIRKRYSDPVAEPLYVYRQRPESLDDDQVTLKAEADR